jgi:hypothetical protein
LPPSFENCKMSCGSVPSPHGTPSTGIEAPTAEETSVRKVFAAASNESLELAVKTEAAFNWSGGLKATVKPEEPLGTVKTVGP